MKDHKVCDVTRNDKQRGSENKQVGDIVDIEKKKRPEQAMLQGQITNVQLVR